MMRRKNGSGGTGTSTTMRVLNLIERRCLAPLKRNDDLRENGARISSRHSSYKKLAQLPLLKLSVLKLDGSVFEIQVGRTATIAELKQAVEDFFGPSQDKISWSLVWGHFCLCHVGQKLINDRAYIRNFGIKDGDQLEFIRHMSISNSPLKKGSKNESVPYKQQPMLTYGPSYYHNEEDLEAGHVPEFMHEDEENCGVEVNGSNAAIQEGNSNYYPNVEDLEAGPVPEFKALHFLKGWLSYSKVVGGFKKGIRRQESSIEIQPTFLRKLM
ncbi:hypothetical protein ACFX1Z_025061 [Malus domestica]